MMKKLMLISVAMLSACGGPEKPAITGVMSEAQMVHLYTEMYIAEEKVNRLGLARDSAEKVFSIIEKKVFEKNAANDSLFRKSIAYYMDRPVEHEKIYTAVVDSLNLREQRTTVKKLKE